MTPSEQPRRLGHLLRSQCELLDAHIGASGIPAPEFAWILGDGSWTGYIDSEVPTLVHLPSRFYFALDLQEPVRDPLLKVRDRGGHLISYSQAHERPTALVRNLSWKGVVDEFMSWLAYLRRELGTGAAPTVHPSARSEPASGPPEQLDDMRKSKTVFVLHGRDERLRRDFFSFLRAAHLHPLEWTEALKLTKKGSPYVGDVLDAAFAQARAVLVLLAPEEDVRMVPSLAGDHPDEGMQPRPNVLFEAGMAFGRNPDHTIIVEVGRIRPFSDIGGRHVLRLNNTPEKRHALVERLKTTGCEVSTVGEDWLKVGDLTSSGTDVDAYRANMSAGLRGAQHSPQRHRLRRYRARSRRYYLTPYTPAVRSQSHELTAAGP